MTAATAAKAATRERVWTRLFATTTSYARPRGVIWDYLPAERIAAMPPLAELPDAVRPGPTSI